jgi:hypothetical protein
MNYTPNAANDEASNGGVGPSMLQPPSLEGIGATPTVHTSPSVGYGGYTIAHEMMDYQQPPVE